MNIFIAMNVSPTKRKDCVNGLQSGSHAPIAMNHVAIIGKMHVAAAIIMASAMEIVEKEEEVKTWLQHSMQPSNKVSGS